jgi:uncharacterized protein (DUF3084 family)
VFVNDNPHALCNIEHITIAEGDVHRGRRELIECERNIALLKETASIATKSEIEKNIVEEPKPKILDNNNDRIKDLEEKNKKLEDEKKDLQTALENVKHKNNELELSMKAGSSQQCVPATQEPEKNSEKVKGKDDEQSLYNTCMKDSLMLNKEIERKRTEIEREQNNLADERRKIEEKDAKINDLETNFIRLQNDYNNLNTLYSNCK